jgi:hypothetical protein
MDNAPTSEQTAQAEAIITRLNTPTTPNAAQIAMTAYQAAYASKDVTALAQAIADLIAAGSGIPL